MQESPAPLAPVVLPRLEPRQEDEDFENVGVPNGRDASFPHNAFPKSIQVGLQVRLDASGVGIVGARFVDQPALERAVGFYEGGESFSDVRIHAARVHRGLKDGFGGRGQERLVLAQEVLRDAEIRLRQLPGIDLARFLVLARVAEVAAIERAVEGLFARSAAA
jgi:hypothetical protein